jgi:hypothetical protein
MSVLYCTYFLSPVTPGLHHFHMDPSQVGQIHSGDVSIYAGRLESRGIRLVGSRSSDSERRRDCGVFGIVLSKFDVRRGKMNVQLIANEENQDRTQCGKYQAGGMILFTCRARKHVGNSTPKIVGTRSRCEYLVLAHFPMECRKHGNELILSVMTCYPRTIMKSGLTSTARIIAFTFERREVASRSLNSFRSEESHHDPVK